MTRDYDSTVARIAGNIAAAVTMDINRDAVTDRNRTDAEIVAVAVVKLARAIIAEVKRTEPKPEQDA